MQTAPSRATAYAPLEREPDERLVERARDGDERAFEALVERHRRALLAHCRRIAGDAADDALQHALLSAWLSLHRRVEVSHPRAWLFTIARRAALRARLESSERRQAAAVEIAAAHLPEEQAQ